MEINRVFYVQALLESERQFHPFFPRPIYSLLASSRPVVPAAGAGSPGVGLVFSWKEMKEKSGREPSIQSRLMCPSVVHPPFCSSTAANRSRCLPPRYRNQNQNQILWQNPSCWSDQVQCKDNSQWWNFKLWRSEWLLWRGHDVSITRHARSRGNIGDGSKNR